MYVNSPAYMPLGETLSGTDAAGNLINSEKLGSICEFHAERLDDSSAKTYRHGGPVRAILLRNSSGATLYGKRLAGCKKTAGLSLVTEVDGYTTTLAQGPVVVIDEGLASTGVAANDLFWGIIGGPVITNTPLSGAAFNATGIAVGDSLIAITGSTTGATTSGRVGGYALANNTDAAGAFAQAANRIGYALSARTSGETNSDLLIYAAINL